jgi:hypothetical protein
MNFPGPRCKCDTSAAIALFQESQSLAWRSAIATGQDGRGRSSQDLPNARLHRHYRLLVSVLKYSVGVVPSALLNMKIKALGVL